MNKNLSWEAGNHSASREISCHFGTQRFIFVFTSACLSWTTECNPYSHSIQFLWDLLIFTCMPRSPKCSLAFRSSGQNSLYIFNLSHACYILFLIFQKKLTYFHCLLGHVCVNLSPKFSGMWCQSFGLYLQTNLFWKLAAVMSAHCIRHQNAMGFSPPLAIPLIMFCPYSWTQGNFLHTG